MFPKLTLALDDKSALTKSILTRCCIGLIFFALWEREMREMTEMENRLDRILDGQKEMKEKLGQMLARLKGSTKRYDGLETVHDGDCQLLSYGYSR